MVQMQDEGPGCGAGSHKDELSFQNEYFSLHTAALFECDAGRKGVAASLLAFAKQALLARSGGGSAFGGAEEVLQHNVQHPSAGSTEGPEPEVLVDVPTLTHQVQWGPSTASASLTGKLPVGKEGRRGDQKRRQEVEEQEVRQDAQWSEDKRKDAMQQNQPKHQADKTKAKKKDDKDGKAAHDAMDHPAN